MLVTAGPTHEKIDPVRFIGNHSSGKMGYAIAEAFAAEGAKVYLVSGPVSIKTFVKEIDVVHVTSAAEMFSACEKFLDSVDLAVFNAAVSVWRSTLAVSCSAPQGNRRIFYRGLGRQ